MANILYEKKHFGKPKKALPRIDDREANRQKLQDKKVVRYIDPENNLKKYNSTKLITTLDDLSSIFPRIYIFSAERHKAIRGNVLDGPEIIKHLEKIFGNSYKQISLNEINKIIRKQEYGLKLEPLKTIDEIDIERIMDKYYRLIDKKLKDGKQIEITEEDIENTPELKSSLQKFAVLIGELFARARLNTI